MKQIEFDKRVTYTLRIELLRGKVLLYAIDTENKQNLMELLLNAETLPFLGFETSLNRKVAIRTNEIARVTFCFDRTDSIRGDAMAYRDNFGVLVGTEEIEDDDEPADNLPKAIIYHKGGASDDEESENPSLYYDLDAGCLAHFALDDETSPLRFLNLEDDDGEESFIPIENIIVMEFDDDLFEDEEAIGLN